MRTVLRGALLGLLATGLVGVPSAASAVPTPECTNVELVASYRGGDAAMSHRFGRIVLRNTSDHACVVQGYGGLSYVGGGDGTQVGAAATRTPGRTPRVVLGPGDRAASRVVETLAAPYPRATCRPAHVDGFRVYLPDETRSQFIAHPTTGCRNTRVHLLARSAYRRA